MDQENSREVKIWNRLRVAGLNAFGAAGVMGNLYRESVLDPQNLQDTGNKKLGLSDAEYTKRVDDGTYTNFVHDSIGYGVAQWTFWSRKQALLNFAKSAGVSIGNLEMQLDFLVKELKEDFPAVWNVLRTAKSVREASNIMLFKFEAPGDQGTKVQNDRAASSQTFYDRYATTATPSSSKGGGHMISNCGHDENNRYSGGAAGDQTGGEWALINWYDRPWDCVLRHPDAAVRAAISKAAKAAAQNNLVGYDQGQRYTFWEHLAASNYDPAQITIKCEADCSSGVAAIVKAVGYLLNIQKLKNVSIYLTTWDLKDALSAAGFKVLTDKKYRTGSEYLLEGDVLLNEQHHTAINVTNGSKADAGSNPTPTPTPTPSPAEAKYKVGDEVEFTGKKHYTSADAANGVACKPGKAKVTMIYNPGVSKHPYHLVATAGSKSTVFGWVDEADIATGKLKSYMVQVKATDLNIRKGPGTNYARTRYIEPGVYTIVGEASGEGASKWGQLKSGEGWISLDYCTKL